MPLEREALADVQFARRDLFPLQQSGEVRWGREIYGVPFGSPQLTVFYRKDLFEPLGLSPPATWTEYQQLAAQLADRETVSSHISLPEDGAWHAVVEPLAAAWSGKLLLTRAAAYARHRSQFSTLFDARTMEPLIAGPPFVKALSELVAAAKLGPSNATSMGPAEARREFTAGRCAMALSWPTRVHNRFFSGG